MVRDFYDEVLMDLVRDAVLDTDMKVLAVCAGQTDKLVLERCGFGMW